jgi:hypothetical protein
MRQIGIAESVVEATEPVDTSERELPAGAGS